MSGAAVSLVERLLVHLPETGGILVLGSISEGAGDVLLAGQLARALEIISSGATLLVQAGPSAPGLAGVGGDIDAESPGLTDVLAGAATLERVVGRSARSDVVCLSLGTRKEQATELVISEAFRGFIKAARLQFHWIVLYSPRLLELRHAASLVARAQAVVVAVKCGRDGAPSVRAIRELCTQLGRPFAGVILT